MNLPITKFDSTLTYLRLKLELVGKNYIWDFLNSLSPFIIRQRFITQSFFSIWWTGSHSWMTIGFTIKLKIFHPWSSPPTVSPISSSRRITRLQRWHCWRSWKKAMNSFKRYPLSVDYKSTTNNFLGSAYERKKHCPFINGNWSCNFEHWSKKIIIQQSVFGLINFALFFILHQLPCTFSLNT